MNNDKNIHKAILLIQAARNIGNPLVKTLAGNLENQNFSEQKKWILFFYTHAFQLLSLLNMALKDKGEVSEFETKIKEFVK